MELGGARDIAVISGSFTIGIISAALLLRTAGWESCHCVAATAMAAAAAGVALFTVYGRRMTDIIPVFIILGICCYAGTAVSGGGITFRGRLADNALLALKERINSLPFSGTGTSALLQALLTGDRSGLAPETVAAFRDSGASHILALSGLHLGVIYGITLAIFSAGGNSFAAWKIRSIATIATCWFYTIMTGAAPSTVRALIFIISNEFLRHGTSRRSSHLSVICTSLLIQLAISPESVTSAGFQLSYLAIFGIITVYPRLESWYPSSGNRLKDKLNPMKRIWNSAAMSLSCQLFTAPLVWKLFRTFPRHFLLTNLIALPPTEALIICTVIALTAESAGLDTTCIAKVVELLADALTGSLGIISSL